jgi:hypothetical protein
MCGDGFWARRLLEGLWIVDDDLARQIRSAEDLGLALDEWNKNNPFDIKMSVQQAVLNGEICFSDAEVFLTRT